MNSERVKELLDSCYEKGIVGVPNKENIKSKSLLKPSYALFAAHSKLEDLVISLHWYYIMGLTYHTYTKSSNALFIIWFFTFLFFFFNLWNRPNIFYLPYVKRTRLKLFKTFQLDLILFFRKKKLNRFKISLNAKSEWYTILKGF